MDIYDYGLPAELIAREPAEPRDSSRLFVYKTESGCIEFDHFYNIDKYLPADSFLVLNQTKVAPARIEMYKKTGGKVKILFLVNELAKNQLSTKNCNIRGYSDRKINIGEELKFKSGESAAVIGQEENIFAFRLDLNLEKFRRILDRDGDMPIPPYIKHSPLNREQLREKYQTVFARNWGSAAAPTASLHFTDQVFRKLGEKGIGGCYLTLHVGMGTFASLTEENLRNNKLHEEYFKIDEEEYRCINTSVQAGKKLIAVGTTVVRTLESLPTKQSTTNPTSPRALGAMLGAGHQQSTISGKTDLFIRPGYNFQMTDIMLTNFHLPKSSLMMLVEAFLQYKHSKHHLVDLYKIAVKEKFRFYSFGDAMLII